MHQIEHLWAIPFKSVWGVRMGHSLGIKNGPLNNVKNKREKDVDCGSIF